MNADDGHAATDEEPVGAKRNPAKETNQEAGKQRGCKQCPHAAHMASICMPVMKPVGDDSVLDRLFFFRFFFFFVLDGLAGYARMCYH